MISVQQGYNIISIRKYFAGNFNMLIAFSIPFQVLLIIIAPVAIFSKFIFSRKASLARFNQSSSKCICMRKKDSR